MSQVLAFDVIIVGAGLAGSSLACALADGDSQLRIALVEAQPLSSQFPALEDDVTAYDPRVSALTVASQRFLERLSVWPALQAQRVGAYQHMHVWDAEGTGVVEFDAGEVNQPALGHIVENRLTVAALVGRLEGLMNVQRFNPVKVQSLDEGEHGRQLLLDDGRQLVAPLIVAADGANSPLRQQAGFTLREWDYQHHAIVVTVQTELPHQQTAWQRFLPEGPLAFLPLGEAAGSQGNFCSIVWSALPEVAEALMQLNDQDFAARLAEAFEHKLGAVTQVSRRFSFPLRQRHAVDYIKPGIVLVGDAAHTIHPLAGQGINLGFSDVRVLAEEVLRARKRSLPLSDPSILQRYQRRRKADNLGMMAAMDGFKRLFAQPSLPIRWLRNAGMNGFNRAPLLKRTVIRTAMGL